MRCLLPEPKDLGESERFLGTNEWRDFGFEFRVPESCALQQVRLVIAGIGPAEQKATGDAWFDRMVVRRAQGLVQRPDAATDGNPNVTKHASDSMPAPKPKSGSRHATASVDDNP